MMDLQDQVTTGDDAVTAPASLQVYRYRPGADRVRTIIGPLEPDVPHDDLVAHADEALRRQTFMCYAVSQADDFVADELCFVPRDGRCEILSIRTNGWQRHHGDHRRSLVDILNDLAAAVACGKLRILDADEVMEAVAAGEALLEEDIHDPTDLRRTRRSVAGLLEQTGIDEVVAQHTVLCVSEAVTNMLLHGGGNGALIVRRLSDRLRFVMVDHGPGLNFLNWLEPAAGGGQASMGYGYKIIVDHLDLVALHTGPRGTTLVLDRLID